MVLACRTTHRSSDIGRHCIFNNFCGVKYPKFYSLQQISEGCEQNMMHAAAVLKLETTIADVTVSMQLFGMYVCWSQATASNVAVTVELGHTGHHRLDN